MRDRRVKTGGGAGRALGSWLLLSLAFAAGTWLAGWWAVPVLAALWGGFQNRSVRRGPLAGVSAATGWGALLAGRALRGPLVELAEVVGPILSLDGVQLFVVTLLFAALLAAAAAGTAGGMRDARAWS